MNKLKLLILALVTLAFISCEKNPAPALPTVTTGVFILNEGVMGASNSNLALYDTDKKQVSHGVFEALNGKGLGDIGNDMLIYGSKAYIAVTGSKIIFITDLEGRLIKEIKHSNDAGELSPRKFTKFDGKVYVSYQEGFVGKIDTTSFEVKHTEAGLSPEGLVAINNKVYIANSGSGSYETAKSEIVSVIDIPTFKKTKTITVGRNPSSMALAPNGNIYVASLGNFIDIAASLQKIDSSTDVSTTITGISPGKMSMGKDNKLYLLSTTYDASYNPSTTYSILNTTTNTISEGFITDGTTVNGYSISADLVTGNVYIGEAAPDYRDDGEMYVFSADGKKINSFDTGGASPSGAFFISK